MSTPLQLVVIDHYDSFTYNLVESFRKLNLSVEVHRPDKGLKQLQHILQDPNKQTILILSPGPGKPSDATVSKALVKIFYNKIPILGICLGHQIIAEALGGEVRKIYPPCHGKSIKIQHEQQTLFKKVPNHCVAARYHSLAVNKLPPNFIQTAQFESIVMAMQHHFHPVFGLQFHPESILTPDGDILLENFIAISQKFYQSKEVSHV